MKVLVPFYILAAVLALRAAPVLVASHKLVRGLKQDIRQPNTQSQDPQQVTNMLKRLVTECSSDVYLLVDVPGLTNNDMLQQKQALWPHLQKYLHLSSSVVGLPWLEGTLDLAYLEQYAVRTCKAESVRAHSSDDEVEQYIDVRKRVILLQTAPLPAERGPERDRAVSDVDDLIRKILRKIPSPHHTIVITSSEVDTVHPLPESEYTELPHFFELFHDIVNDPRRELEQERNAYLYQDVAPFWNEIKDPTQQFLERKRRDEVHLFDKKLWGDNEKLVMTVVLMVGTFVLTKTVAFGRSLKQKVVEKRR